MSLANSGVHAALAGTDAWRLFREGGLATHYTVMKAGEAAALLERQYGIRGSLHKFATEKDDTFRVEATDGKRYVLKIANPHESMQEIDLQLQVLRHVEAHDPALPVPRVVESRDGTALPIVMDAAGQTRRMRVLSFLEGKPLDTVESASGEREQVGVALARLRLAMSGFAHPMDSRELAWDIRHLLTLAPLIEGVADASHRRLLTDGLERYARIAPAVARLRTQVLHNDFSRSNIVVAPGNPVFVRGIIDFGDVVRTAVAIDVSTALLNQLPRTQNGHAPEDLFAHGRDLLGGYLKVADLTQEELTLVPHLTMGRVITRALLTTWRARMFPGNATYILRNTVPGWAQLEWFLRHDFDEVSTALLDAAAPSRHLATPPIHPEPTPEPAMPPITPPGAAAAPPGGKMNNAFDPSRADGLGDTLRGMIERRSRLLGPAYRLFYRNPVEVSRGQGVLLYDRDGNEYLDAYNNVVSVGHCHPRVVAAVHRQMQTLCTHTRYVQEGILDYAEDLLSTFGGRVGGSGHAMFTCTGSEANDLAMRIAMHHTGKRGIIITEEAYHGNSHLTAGFSPSLGERSPLGPWVRQVPAPDSYRLAHENLGEWMAEHVAAQIRDLERHGEGLAAFIVDSAFSSDGIYVEPTTLLAPVARVVKEAGGVFVADEVQSGFGRLGDTLWGYQRHGIDPDIVTMGKPMGNGFPVAGLAVAPDIVAGFGIDQRYFNTFGGNSVAIAAAQAVLDVIREEGLLENTRRVGGILRQGLLEFAKRYESIGDVRGSGLYLGIELVKDRATGTPDQAKAAAIVNALRERRVLISATGFHGNTLKIRPPLVFAEKHASRFLAELDGALADVGA